MIVVTSETIAGKRIVKTLGLVRGNTVRARHIGRDIMAGLRNIVGGEIYEYGKLIAESREQSLDRMIAEAAKRGANAKRHRRHALHHLDDDGRRRRTTRRGHGCHRRRRSLSLAGATQ